MEQNLKISQLLHSPVPGPFSQSPGKHKLNAVIYLTERKLEKGSSTCPLSACSAAANSPRDPLIFDAETDSRTGLTIGADSSWSQRAEMGTGSRWAPSGVLPSRRCRDPRERDHECLDATASAQQRVGPRPALVTWRISTHSIPRAFFCGYLSQLSHSGTSWGLCYEEEEAGGEQLAYYSQEKLKPTWAAKECVCGGVSF